VIKDWTYSSAIDRYTWNTIKITMNGTFVKIFINGQLIGYGNFSALSAGQVGIGFYGAGAGMEDDLYIEYATLSTTAPASVTGQSLEGAVNFDELSPFETTAAGDRHRAP
jgi:hypothetical protein